MKMRRLTAYVASSVALATIVVSWAALERPNFYSAAVYLSQSNACLMILCNLALVITGSLLYTLQHALFGPLRAAEVEQLWEKGWFAVMEWVFAMSTFRDEFGIWFLIMFLSMFGTKVWGWIAEGRVEQLEQQPPVGGRLYQPRLIASLVLYLGFAIQMFRYNMDIVLYEARPGMTVLFVFEFAILWISAVSTCIRYGVWIQEHRIMKGQLAKAMEDRRVEIRAMRTEEEARAAADTTGTRTPAEIPSEEDLDENDFEVPGWEAKRGWLFVLDIATDLLKLTAYISFFTILTVFYGIPIYIIRDLYVTLRNFTKRITDYVKYQKATRDMHTRYPDATAEEMESDNTCIVCREEMRPWGGNANAAAGEAAVALPGTTTNDRQRPKKLPCGHILHFSCLQSWLERQQSCPTCRRSVFAAPVVRGQQGGVNPAAGAAGGVGAGLGGDAQGGANNPNHNANGNAPGVPGAANPLGQNRNQGRVFRLGPIRLQFGGRMNRRDDQQELLDILGRLARQRAANFQNGQPNAVAAQVMQPAQQVPTHNIGAIAANAHPGLRSATTHLQLNIIEQQIRQEIAALNVASDRLAGIRNLQNVLGNLQGFPQVAGVRPPVQQVEGIAQHNLQLQSPALPVIARADGQHGQGVALPQGLVLPPGWNLVPLNQVNQVNQVQHGTQAAVPTPTPTIPPQSSSRAPSQPAPSTAATPSGVNGLSSHVNGAPTAPTTNGKVPEVEDSKSDSPLEPPPTAPSSTWSFGNVDGGDGGASKSTTDVASQSATTSSSSGEEKQPTVEDVKED
ncbi:hypothetical protein EJ08DRAFT_679870 [Tothia fuscella]|uniref:RING-type E3 ubiquitin transferase n=1 Tax=Tothia fuscella TaxID=1048955 RepID=A0A9P4NPU8_9PEZI|nr:hypothetical protein EJ08DRAFT_679870 [Tothia fuscella]